MSSKPNRFENNPKLVFSLLAGMITIAVLVLGFFIVKAVRDEVNRGIQRSIILRENRPYSDLYHKPSPATLASSDGLEDRPYRMRVDENGFIKPSRVHSKADLSIVFLGGSTTECMYVEEENRFPYLFGRLLEQSTGLKVNSYNGGHSGNNSLHCVLALQGKVLPMRPQVAVLMECANDLNYLMAMRDYWSPHASRGIIIDKEYNPIKTFIIRNLIGHKGTSAIYEDEFEAVRGKQPGLADKSYLVEQYRRNIELFVYICRQHKILPVLMTQFNRLSENPDAFTQETMKSFKRDWNMDYETYRGLYMALNDAMRNVAKEQDVPLIDLDRLVPKERTYLFDTIHLNDTGSKFVANVLSERLEPILRERGVLK